MKSPSTETLVFGLLAALPVAGNLAALAMRWCKQPKVDARKEEMRVLVLMTLLSLVLLAAAAAYFWFFDPASASLREWFGMRGDGGGV